MRCAAWPSILPGMPSSATDRWTTRALLQWMGEAFRQAELESPRLLAELLLAHALGCERMRLYMDADRPATPEERATLRRLAARALQHEPVQYLVGEAVFYTHTFRVDPRVLIPRPSSATLLDLLIEHAQRRGWTARTPYDDESDDETTTLDETPAEPVIADVCTGSGCLAISAAKAIPRARVLASDVSEDALEVARDNAHRLGVADRVSFARGDLLEPLLDSHGNASGTFDAIISNPPYIPEHEWADVPRNVKDHEPHLALRGGDDGLRFVRPLLEHAPERLAPGGLLAIEIAASTAQPALAIARGISALDAPRIVNDFEGLPRVITATRAAQ